MKKRKVGFLFNIITICLAVVAIAVGVYSLQKSSLNISGSLGFTAHNVNARIDAYMYGYATEAGGVPLTESEKVRLTSANGLLIHDSLTEYSLNLGATNGTGTATRYFSNLGTSGNMEDIVVEITISNTSGGTSSPKNILANVDFANCIPSSALTDKIRIDCDRSAAVLETTNEKTQATFTFKISLLPDSTGSYGDSALTSPSNNVSLKMNLEETTYTQSQVKTDAAIKQFTTTEVDSIKTGLGSVNIGSEKYEYGDTYKCYAERYPYYVKMGERNNEKVKWLIVGTFANDSVTALTDSDKTPLSQGYMLKETSYVMLSEKLLYTESTSILNCGISFQNKYTNSGEYLNDYGYSAQDYATSNIRNYLKGADVYRTATSTTDGYIPDESKGQINLLTTYNLTSDPLYAKIQERTLPSLYNESAISGEIKEMKTVPTTIDGKKAVDSTSDKLWLLSQTEMEEIFKADYVANSRESYSNPVYMSSRTGVLGRSNAYTWWLRSPYSSLARSVRRVYASGEFGSGGAADDYCGTRPAFLF